MNTHVTPEILHRENDPRFKAKIAITKKVNRMVGHDVKDLWNTLSILTHPDVLPLLKHLIELQERES